MAPTPEWVKALRPSDPQGSVLLQEERRKSNLNVDQLSEFLFTKEALDRRERILKILQSNAVFDKTNNYFDGRVDRLQRAMARAKRLRQLSVDHAWSEEEYLTANELISEPTPYGLHEHMYLVRLPSATHPSK